MALPGNESFMQVRLLPEELVEFIPPRKPATGDLHPRQDAGPGVHRQRRDASLVDVVLTVFLHAFDNQFRPGDLGLADVISHSPRLGDGLRLPGRMRSRSVHGFPFFNASKLSRTLRMASKIPISRNLSPLEEVLR